MCVCCVKVEFTRGLLQEVELKLCNDIQDTVQDDLLMAHLIDELILFSRELTLIGYPPSSPSPLSVLLDPAPFSKWLSLERQCKQLFHRKSIFTSHAYIQNGRS